MFYCRDSAGFGVSGVSASNKLDRAVLRNRQLAIPPTVLGHAENTPCNFDAIKNKRVKNRKLEQHNDENRENYRKQKAVS